MNKGIAVAMPLAIAVATTFCTIVVHGLALVTIVRLVRHEFRLGRAGVRFRQDVLLVAGATLLTLAAHLIEIGLWALVLASSGEFTSLSAALYHSAVNYTSLGYGNGDVLMSVSWRLLGPLETADGMLMFGVSTATIFAVIQRLVQTAFGEIPRPRPS
jgi:ion channel